MAEFRTWNAFDIRAVDFGAQYLAASDRFLDRNYHVHGEIYPDALVLEFGAKGNETTEYYGQDFVVEGNEITGGTMTAIYGWFLNKADDEWYYNLEFRGFSVSAQTLHSAMLTESRLDDRAMIREMLAGDDSLVLSSENDRMEGFGGNDTISGGGGSDRLIGGAGADVLTGGRGHDVLSGGTGRDFFFFAEQSGADVITDFATGVDRIRILAGATGFGDLTLTEVDAGVKVEFGEASILLRKITLEGVSEADFLFV